MEDGERFLARAPWSRPARRLERPDDRRNAGAEWPVGGIRVPRVEMDVEYRQRLVDEPGDHPPVVARSESLESQATFGLGLPLRLDRGSPTVPLHIGHCSVG